MEPVAKKIKVTSATGSGDGTGGLVKQIPLKTYDGETRHSVELHPDFLLRKEEDGQDVEKYYVDMFSTFLAAGLQQDEDTDSQDRGWMSSVTSPTL